MSEKQEEPLTNEAEPENSSPGAPEPAGLSQSAAAGREFLKALYRDLTRLVASGTRFLRRREKSSDRARKHSTAKRVLLGFVQLFAVFLGLAAAALATGMAWALRDLPPLARPIGDTEAPSLVLELQTASRLAGWDRLNRAIYRERISRALWSRPSSAARTNDFSGTGELIRRAF
jgi:hypothetical protein